MIINGQRYEAEPAVEAYVKDLQAENEEQRREILRLTDELKEMDGANEYLRNQSAKDFENVLKFMDTIGALKKENAQLEESFQKATGEIAADPLPGECRNKAKTIDDFICSQCGINLVDLAFVEKEEYEDGYKDEVRYVYEPKFCPECGRKVQTNDR